MGQCTTCKTLLKPLQTECHKCGATISPTALRQIPTLNPLSTIESDEDFQTVVTQREPLSPPPKTMPMVPPPFTPPPQIVPLAPPKAKSREPLPSPLSEDSEDDFASGLGDFTEIADEIPSQEQEDMSDEVFDHTIDLEPEEFYSLDGEADFTPFPTAQFTSPSATPDVSAPPSPPSFPSPPASLAKKSSTDPLKVKGPPKKLDQSTVSVLLVLAQRAGKIALQAGAQKIGAQHDPTGALLDELYPHHFSVEKGHVGVKLVPVSSDAELWIKVARRTTLKVGDIIRVGRTKLMLAKSTEVLSSLHRMKPKLPLAHTAQLSLLAFNPAGLLEGVYPLQEGVSRIGRALADITLSDPTLNVSHAALLLEEGDVTIVDLGSESGIWSQVLKATPLKRNDVFSAGHTLFVAR